MHKNVQIKYDNNMHNKIKFENTVKEAGKIKKDEKLQFRFDCNKTQVTLDHRKTTWLKESLTRKIIK